jgi:hypothetical protein
MTKFTIKAEVTVTYLYQVEADTITKAIDMVEADEADDCFEHDSSAPQAVEYMVEGRAGWIDARNWKDAHNWSGSPCPVDPDNFWIDDATGERIPA